MKFTRKEVEALIADEELSTGEKVNALFDAHTKVTSGLQDKLEEAQEGAKKVPALEKQVDDYKAAIDGKDPFEDKYNTLKAEYDTYKEGIETEKATAAIKALFKAELDGLNIKPKYADSILKTVDLEKLKGFETKDGAYTKPKDVQEYIKAEYGGFVPVTDQQGSPAANPPSNNPGTDAPTSIAAALREKYTTKG